MPALPSTCTTLAIRKSADAPFYDPTGTGVVKNTLEKNLTLRKWASGQSYKQDEQVLTTDTNAAPTNFIQWRVKADHTAGASDQMTAAGATAAAILTATNYERVELGEIYSVDSIELSADASETSYKFMREKVARATSTPNPVSITVNLFSMADRQAVERFFARTNASAYIEIIETPNPANPFMADATGIRIRGQARLASSTKSYPSDAGNITKSLVFNSDGGTFYEEEFKVGPTPDAARTVP